MGALCDQQSHQLKPGVLRQSRKASRGFLCFHLSSIAEMIAASKIAAANQSAESARFRPVMEISPGSDCHAPEYTGDASGGVFVQQISMAVAANRPNAASGPHRL